MVAKKGTVVLLGLVILGIGIAIGFCINYLTKNADSTDAARKSAVIDNNIGNFNAQQILLDEIKAENIRENLRKITEHPHLAGTPADFDQANDLKNLWQEQGYKAWLAPYNVLLSYPDENNPNKIELQDGSGSALYTTQLKEKIVRQDQDQPNVVPPFNAYSAAGQPKGHLIYVNYGRIEDFKWLKDHKNMNFTDSICIARYGKIFRGSKAMFGQEFGCAGMILYTDPKDYNMASVGQNVYPDSWWMPPTGVQRGTVFVSPNDFGDPLTPGYPAIESAYRSNYTDLLKIPVHPISYGDAQILLQNMTGEEVPVDWRGGLSITYRLGPGFKDPQRKVQMFINTRSKNATTYNAFAMIKGTVEPDRYVLVGNHRDAWVFGAVDPSSGTAAMMELSRAISSLIKQGWKPRRSIIFCSWGAEEFGLIGVTEWVEQYNSLLAARAVAYINVDVAVAGNYSLLVQSLPMIQDTIYEATRKIPNPDPREVAAGRKTLYDTWCIRDKELDIKNKPTGKPRIPIPGSGSDHAPFITKVGVTSVLALFDVDTSVGITSYPLYHSVYETFHLVNDIMDPGFVYHKALTQLWGELARRLSEAPIIPYDARKYPMILERLAANMESEQGDLMRQNGLTKNLNDLNDAIHTLKHAAEEFHQRLKTVDVNNPLHTRMVNDQLMSIDRVFIDPNGLPGRPFTRNVLFAQSAHDTYAGVGFPGIVDTLYGIEDLSGQEFMDRWEQVKQEMSIVTFYIQQAAALLNDYTEFQYY